ncbi:hypothetical protein QTP70_009016 [Hemibagrus guttatus]|uniref:Uncharacterized protein n=1 Tax=Hemibagrus guttatus TaxID=175788 RepID=A0AAE0Q133_9TELE|nr:hypothetical protein QTP70_009016 [Hemibagrus guttatus]
MDVEVPQQNYGFPSRSTFQHPSQGLQEGWVLHTAIWPISRNNSETPIPGPKAQGNNPLVYRGKLQHMAAELGGYKQAHPSPTPLTMGPSPTGKDSATRRSPARPNPRPGSRVGPRSSSTGDLVPKDITEMLALQNKISKSRKKRGSSLSQTFSWFKGSKPKRIVSNGQSRSERLGGWTGECSTIRQDVDNYDVSKGPDKVRRPWYAMAGSEAF